MISTPVNLYLGRANSSDALAAGGDTLRMAASSVSP